MIRWHLHTRRRVRRANPRHAHCRRTACIPVTANFHKGAAGIEVINQVLKMPVRRTSKHGPRQQARPRRAHQCSGDERLHHAEAEHHHRLYGDSLRLFQQKGTETCVRGRAVKCNVPCLCEKTKFGAETVYNTRRGWGCVGRENIGVQGALVPATSATVARASATRVRLLATPASCPGCSLPLSYTEDASHVVLEDFGATKESGRSR